MSMHYLNLLFSPRSIAVIGASSRMDSVGGVVFKNMLESGYQGKFYAVNPNHSEIQGVQAYAGIESIPETVDLAVIITRAATVPDIVESCGKCGVRFVLVLSAGFRETGPQGAALEQAVVENARRYGMRLIGPNCLGILCPWSGLNVTFSNGGAKAGGLALISQSGAFCTAIMDWAKPNDVGFSNIISMGAAAGMDFGEILDYLASDPHTDSILLYIEGIQHARSFMSALRAAARIKPIFIVKAGRHATGSKAAFSHSGALVGSDDVFDAALQRAGVVRVDTIVQLFSAAQALSTHFRPGGNRLAIVTNGGGPGVMAVDRATDLGVTMATLSDETLTQLNALLPATWSHGNPLDIIGDATAERYRHAVAQCLQDDGVDGVLVILTPQAMTQPLEVAHAVIELAAKFDKPLIACWMGEVQVAACRQAFNQAKIPNFRTPEPAVEVFSFISAYYQNQKLLLQTPGPISDHCMPDEEGARLLIEGALAEHRKILSEIESKAILAAFRIPIAKAVVVRSPNEALLIAEEFGFPVAMKINSPDITHKSDAGGVRLNLGNAQAVRSAYHDIIQAVQKKNPDARIDGIIVEPMIVKPNGRELMVGVTTDAVFGPVITFGAGGVLVEVLGDRAVALPPLNDFLVKDMIQRTRVAKLLSAFRHMPPVDRVALESILLRVSEMVCALPWIKEMDINPLIIDEHGACAADARIVVDYLQPSADRYAHMAIHPYPAHLITRWQLPDGTDLTIRPIRPEDAEIEQAFVRGLSAESKYFRFMDALQELSQSMLVRFTQIDYDREMALIAVLEQDGREQELGVCRYMASADGQSCEFALVVADEWQNKGIGNKLMNCLFDAARAKGIKVMEGEVLAANGSMLELVRRLGFAVSASQEDVAVKRVVKPL
ncbi:MAG: bifunctional acetate--CoA ligase family protein/GNAT family N-acetyltransferase [Gammaproteobacteria bacterium]|nr:MAG: bifunctional acetate--CoA ligase family protein/GNAT family N-acetyltransferase [Gammaproteobacteria bacterium]